MSISLTLSNLDGETYRLLQAEATRKHSDVESVAKTALAKGLEVERLAKLPKGPPYHDLDFLAGTWTESEAKEFLDIVSEFRHIDREIWQ